jgi:GrpB-like predicted nucleotidyltransferase (UPF0157 family)
LKTPLEELGFVLGEATSDHTLLGVELGPDDLAKRFYTKRSRAMNLHVRKIGAFNQRYALLFRDYLRSNSIARESYGEFKRLLAKEFREDLKTYCDIKDPVCDLIMAGALQWAEETGWKLERHL